MRNDKILFFQSNFTIRKIWKNRVGEKKKFEKNFSQSNIYEEKMENCIEK